MNKLVLGISILCFGLKAFAAHHEDHGHEHKEGEAMVVQPEKSEIVWTGEKKFVDSAHTGTIQLKSGQIYFKDGEPVHGDFVIDMKTIKNVDLEDEEYKKKLEGHLSSDDFFAVEKFEVAKFTFDNVKALGENQYAFTGDMQIRDVTKKETIQATIDMNEDGTGFTATADAVIDRTKYGIEYNNESSGNSDDWFFVKWFKGGVAVAKDKIIKNDMNISIKLVAEK